MSKQCDDLKVLIWQQFNNNFGNGVDILGKDIFVVHKLSLKLLNCILSSGF